jgi:hypothetical protein
MEALMPRDLESVIAEALLRDPPYDFFKREWRSDPRQVAAAVREYLLSDEAVQRAAQQFDLALVPKTTRLDDIRPCVARAALAAALGVETA